MDIGTFAEHIQGLCEMHNGSITSWYRSAKRNKAVGGAKNSRHLKGLAVDMVLDDMSDASRKLLIDHAKALGFYTLDEKDHVHINVKV